MRIDFIRKLKVEFTNEEIQALKTTEKIIKNIQSELEDNDIDDDETEEIIGEAYNEHYTYCSNDISDIISEIIGLADC